MKEILITSSVLILALLLLRLIFAKRVNRKLIYGAWMLVAIRLLIPVQVGQLAFSVLTAARPLTETVADITDLRVAGQTERDAHKQVIADYIENNRGAFTLEWQERIEQEVDKEERTPEDVANWLDKIYTDEELFLPEIQQQVQQQVMESTNPIKLGQVATVVWLAGSAAMAVWFVTVNLRCSYQLRHSARMQECESSVPVYVSDKIGSPCLLGLFRPRIYLTASCVTDVQKLRHVLLHEQNHYAHKDHLWSLLRCVCLCIYWFDPLVWVAACVSRRDCELACDEGALKQLGEGERIAYGKTLLDVVSQASTPGKLLQTATSMGETKEQLKERIGFIVRKPKTSFVAAICMVLVCFVVAGCVAAGPVSSQDDSSVTAPPTTGTTVPTTTAPMDDPYQIQRYDYYLGETITITLTPAQSNIQDSKLEYGWATVNGVLYAKCLTPPYRFEYVNGSDRYVTVTMEGGQTYRIDVQTGETFDPESILGDLPLSAFTYFTSDGQYAVLSYGDSLCVLLNCVTGEVTQLAYEENVYAVWAKFMDDNHVLICSRYKTDATGKESLTLAVYNISTGEYKQIPGEYQSEDPAEENYLFAEENCAVYTFADGQLTVMDLLTGESVVYPFGYDVFVDYNRHGMLIAVVYDTEYVLYKDGTYQEITR